MDIDNKDPEFEDWLGFNFQSIVLKDFEDELYEKYYEDWKQHTREKADSLTERKPDGTAIIPD